MVQKYKLIYGNYKGRGEPIRLMFKYAGVDFEDQRLSMEDWPTFKETTPWGQIPLLEVDGVILAQSRAIARFLAIQFKMNGKDEFEAAKCDEYVDTLEDVMNEIIKWFFEKDKAEKTKLLKKLEEEKILFYFGKFETILNGNESGFLVGNKLPYADIYLATFLESLAVYAKGVDLEKFQVLQKHNKLVMGQSGIKEWIEIRPQSAN